MNATEDKTYNGWTNYETWVVNLWLGNDEGSYNYWRERTTEAMRQPNRSAVLDDKEHATQALADMLKSEFEESNPVADQSSVWADLMSAALSDVNWQEIAGHMVDDAE